jgi:hypothetical protein
VYIQARVFPKCEPQTGSSLFLEAIDFKSCLPILSAYLPLKFPNGQFPLKIPGPISQTKLKQKKKKLPLIFFFLNGGTGSSLFLEAIFREAG